MEHEGGQRRLLYRIVKTDPPTLEDFTSGASRGRPIPSHLPENLHRLWDGLSAYATLAQVRRKHRASPTIGRFVAVLVLTLDRGIRVERTTRESGRHTIWGPPEELLASVLEVLPAHIPIEGEESR